MANIYGAMNIAKQALITHQLSLEVTGQNIANVNNPNFTRQEVQLEAAFPIQPGGAPGMIGTGVRATSIIRRFDQFLEGQRLTNKSLSGYWDARQDVLSRLEVVFNESSETGLNSVFDKFFLSWQNLAFNPAGLTERTDVVAQGQTMSTMFQKLDEDMSNLRDDLDSKIVASTIEINKITTEIAELNKAIHEAESYNVTANDFRDKRDKAVRDLAEYMDVNVVEDSNNQTTVYVNGGRPIVIGQTSFTLSTSARADDAQTSDVFWADSSNNLVEITEEIAANGKVGSWIKLRDTELPDFQDKLDLLAATMVREINSQNSKGYGLDGSTGNDYFAGLNLGTTASRDNTGAGTINAGSIVDPERVNLHKFQITHSGGNLTIIDLTNNKTVATEAYTSGGNIAYLEGQGIQTAISGALQDGDVFTVNAADGAAGNIGVSTDVVNDTNKIAAGLTSNNGDGSNALLVAQEQNDLNMNKDTAVSSGTATFSEFYNSIVGDVGVVANESIAMYNQQEGIVFEIERRREQVSGVSLDEEMVNLIKFQQAYQAAARLIGVIDELLQTLVSLGR